MIICTFLISTELFIFVVDVVENRQETKEKSEEQTEEKSLSDQNSKVIELQQHSADSKKQELYILVD